MDNQRCYKLSIYYFYFIIYYSSFLIFLLHFQPICKIYFYLLQINLSKTIYIFSSHQQLIKNIASSYGIYMSFRLMLPFSSPRIFKDCLLNLIKTAIVILSNFIILINYQPSYKIGLFVGTLFRIYIFEAAFLRGLLDPSLRINGKLAMFLMTYFCFFHYYLSFAVSQFDFFSCNLFKSLKFYVSIVQVCFLRKGQFKLLFILLSTQESLLCFFRVECVILYKRHLFSRQISVILSSIILCFFY